MKKRTTKADQALVKISRLQPGECFIDHHGDELMVVDVGESDYVDLPLDEVMSVQLNTGELWAWTKDWLVRPVEVEYEVGE